MSSPALNDKAFDKSAATSTATDAVMTVNGTINKTLILVGLAVLTATITWRMAYDSVAADGALPSSLMPLMIGGVIGGLIFALIAIFSPRNSGWASPLYALCEGLFLGAVSALYNQATSGIVFNAVVLTLLVLFLMLVLYRTRVIKVTQKLRSGIIIATGAVAVFYLVTMVSSFFTPVLSSFMAGSSALSIGLSLLIVGIAAFNFLLDFDFIERGAQVGAPKYMEWYGAFGLMLTLVWLYLEMLRLLSKISRN